MNSEHSYRHSRTFIPVSVNPRDDQRFIRFRSNDGPSNDIQNRMSASMREFEERCRQWREKFLDESRWERGFPSASLTHSRPRMNFDFPDFPEFGSIDWPSFRGPAPGFANSGQKAFIEEDNDGRKRYKVQFDIGEFRPEELNVKVEGRMLIVKGDRQVKVGNASESKQFNRELTLPEFIDVKSLQSYLSNDGMLTMEAPVLMDRFYQDGQPLASISSRPNRPLSPIRAFDNSFATTGNQFSSPSNFGTGNQSNSFSSTSSASTYRYNTSGVGQGGNAGLANSSSFLRNSPSRDPYSTSSSSTLVGGSNSNFSNPAPVTHSTVSPQPVYSTTNRHDGMKMVTYEFDLHDFAPEDIAIQVNDTMLKVSALRQEQTGNSSSHREFKREIGLPEGAEAKQLTNTLSINGILTINIPVRDFRPPLTPTQQSQSFSLPATMNQNDSYSMADQQLKLTFDLSGYKPDDVTVKVNNNVLKVQAVHNEYAHGNQINREYMREYVLPEWVNADHLRAKMSEDSTLTVEVPIPQDRVPSLNRQIKITQ